MRPTTDLRNRNERVGKPCEILGGGVDLKRRAPAWGLAAGVLTLACLQASSASAASRSAGKGIVTGIAVPCTGTFLSSKQSAGLRIRVTLRKGSQTIATKTVSGDHAFRFAVQPGRHVLSSNQGTGGPPVPVNVAAGTTIRASTTCYLS
jgi:hypothetical protein